MSRVAPRMRHGETQRVNAWNRSALGLLVTFLDRHGRPDPAAILAGFACVSPTSAPTVPELGTAITHLRDVLGNETYEALARKGEMMTNAGMVAYAYDQIDQARTELEAVSE